MRKLRLSLLTLGILAFLSVKADEGMWLLQLMQEQHLSDMMKKQGLKLENNDLYNPQGISLKDAVGIFGGGCTGELISPNGLVLTNHHCGYDAIQQHSSVEHDYLTDGFWAKDNNEEIPTPGLEFTFIERIEDLTDLVNSQIKDGKISEQEAIGSIYLSTLAKEALEKSDLKDKAGISAEALPFYAGNKYYLIYKKKYTDVRMVGTPPSSIGKFGGETDNWMWPRHTGDFSIFRIYADANGEPAEYSETNIPLKNKKHLPISLKGLDEGDYSMVMGFPGRTNRYMTASEVEERARSNNEPMARIRGVRQQVMSAEMKKDAKTRIQYASKYARSSNYWKNSIGMNKAIKDNSVIEKKLEQEAAFATFAAEKGDTSYASVVKQIDEIVAQTAPISHKLNTLVEAFIRGIEFTTSTLLMQEMSDALDAKDNEQIASTTAKLRNRFYDLHNKDYDHEVDRKIAKALLKEYVAMTSNENNRPEIFTFIKNKYKGNIDAFVDDCYNKSIFANEANFEKFIAKPSRKAINKDLSLKFDRSVNEKYKSLSKELAPFKEQLITLHKTYVRGLGEMKLPTPSYPDANFTIRLSYGNVKSYNPKDGIHFNYFTTMRGIMEKEDEKNREFNVPAQLKELYNKGDFGRYAMKSGEMPVCFTSTNDITGGNSGSPVINANGELIGCAFDGNWESLSGDISFDPELQRCINVDIRYVLFIIEKLGGAKHLVDEMTIIE